MKTIHFSFYNLFNSNNFKTWGWLEPITFSTACNKLDLLDIWPQIQPYTFEKEMKKYTLPVKCFWTLKGASAQK